MNLYICDIKQLSFYLNISVSEVRKLVRERRIPYFRIGNRIKFNIDTINDWIGNLEQIESQSSVLY